MCNSIYFLYKCYERITKKVAHKCMTESMKEFIGYVQEPGLNITHQECEYLK